MAWRPRKKGRLFTLNEGIVCALAALAFVIVLLAHVFVLPPFEGFDETAHYSYISYLSDQHGIPDFRTTLLDGSIETNRAGLPERYGGRPPYDSVQGVTYHQFFTRLSDSARNEAYRGHWRTSQPVRYRPGEDLNWQGQHPPLYYLLMTVPYRLTVDSTPAARLLTLRLVSLLIACGSLFFWYRTVRLFGDIQVRSLLVAGGIFMCLMPSLPFDLARIGNDSLVALLFSGVFYFLARSVVHGQRLLTDHWGIAVMLALGLWTKVVFLPVLLGVAGLTAWLYRGKAGPALGQTTRRVLIVAGVPLLAASAWYWMYYQRYGILAGGVEAYQIGQAAQPFVDQVSTGDFVLRVGRAVSAFIGLFLWSGTWSLVQRPLWQYGLAVPAVLLLTVGVFRAWRERLSSASRQLVAGAGVILLLTVLALLHHMYVHVRLVGVGSGGYYLFALWPALGLVASFALSGVRSRVLRPVTLVVFLLVIYSGVSGFWFEMQVYAGLVVKAGAVKVGAGAVWPTLSNVSLAVSRLQYLAYPLQALLLYGLAVILQLFLAVVLVFGYGEKGRSISAQA